MDLFTLFLLALGLSMDAFAVSITDGMYFCHYDKKINLLIALMFGLFQGMMPVIGYFTGQAFSDYIQSLDHWLALILLSFIGGKMILEAIKSLKTAETYPTPAKTFSFKLITVQAIATSIDALAVGISLAFLKVNILIAASFIGLVTFLCCFAGFAIGKKFGNLFQQKAEILGGIILILIGVKIFLEHTMMI
ncbi:MAG: manganese efflux pump MntP family protein [Clostridiales bacterium]